MALPTMPKKEPRPIAVTVRLSELAVEMLKGLAEAHNLSQADVIEYLVKDEYRKSHEILQDMSNRLTTKKKSK